MIPGTVFGRYRIDGELGRGGMGRVYRAWDLQLGRPVALKVVSEALSHDAAALILREARAAARLAHPGAVTVYDATEVDGVPVLAMELVEGRSLRAALREGVPLELRIRWLALVADVLGEAHRFGLVHRDIKPENVMVRADGAIKVLDFGIARWDAGDAMTMPGPTSHPERVKGTLKYMAPEQLRGEALDGRADQYAWGVLAYEVLTGVHPVTTAPEVSTVEFVIHRHPPPLHEVAPAVPFGVSAVVTRAMAKERDARFGSMAEVAAALREASAITAPAFTGPGPVPSATQQDAIGTAVHRPSAPMPPAASSLAPAHASPPVAQAAYGHAPGYVHGGAPPQSKSSPLPWMIAGAALLLLVLGLGAAGLAVWWTTRPPEAGATPALSDAGAVAVSAQPTASPVATVGPSEDAGARPVATVGPRTTPALRADAGARTPSAGATASSLSSTAALPTGTPSSNPPVDRPRTMKITAMNTFFNYDPSWDPPGPRAAVDARAPSLLNCYRTNFDAKDHVHDFSVTYELRIDATGRVTSVTSTAKMHAPLLACATTVLTGVSLGTPKKLQPPPQDKLYLMVRYD